MRSSLLLGAALAGVVGWSVYGGKSATIADMSGAGQFSCSVASITDGDTLRCADGTRVRIAGIAARERDGSCSPGHPCPAASAESATAALDRLASGRVLSCQANGTTYGRIAAFCSLEDGTDVSCSMVATGTALVWPRYWRGHRC